MERRKAHSRMSGSVVRPLSQRRETKPTWGLFMEKKQGYCLRMWFKTSIWPSILGWYEVLMRNKVPLSLKSYLQNLLIKFGSRSKTVLWGKPWSVHTISRNNWATLKAVKWVSNAAKCEALEKWSTTTKIKWDIFQIAIGREKGWRRPAGHLVLYLMCWQVWHCSTNYLTSCRIPN